MIEIFKKLTIVRKFFAIVAFLPMALAVGIYVYVIFKSGSGEAATFLAFLFYIPAYLLWCLPMMFIGSVLDDWLKTRQKKTR